MKTRTRKKRTVRKMALLTKAQADARLKYLGYGGYSKSSILKFQKDAFKDKSLHDGVHGPITDTALRHFYNVRRATRSFKPQEFRCNCGHCSGYPTHMRQVELKHLQKIRDHYGKPMEITSGLRCAYENKRVGGVPNSSHLSGYAADFHISGVTDTAAQRTETLKYIKGLPNHQFSYGAYIVDSEGKYWASGSMGNAMHTETHQPKKTKSKSKYYNAKTIIGEARCNENGQLYGGKPGDQTGKEVGMGNWYSGGWLYVFRPKDPQIAEKMAQAMMDTCNNSNIGYNASDPARFGAWDNAEKNGHNIKGISKKGDTTCSQAVSMCMRAAGIPKKYAPRMMNIDIMTRVMPKNPYFDMFTDKKHTKSASKLKPGDVTLSTHHTVIVVKSPNAE